MSGRILVFAGFVFAAGCAERALSPPTESADDAGAPMDAGPHVVDLGVDLADPDLTSTDIAADDLHPTDDLVFLPGPHALHCDGHQAIVSVAMPTPTDMPRALTVEWWYRSDDPRVDFEGTMVTNGPVIGRFYRERFVDAPKTRHMFAVLEETFDTTAPQESWRHVALQYQQQSDGHVAAVVFLDGKSVASKTLSATSLDNTVLGPLSICGEPTLTPTPNLPFGGFLDEVRVSKIARYAGDFTPADFVADDDTLALLHFDTLPLIDSGPNAYAVTVKGNVSLGAPHP